MGCDIHAVFQAKKNGRWIDVESEYDERRHYFLFAWLANVRNGYGFAGVPTHDPVSPIAEPRGVPKGLTLENDEHNGKWLGDHSHSWLTADEIMSAPRPESGIMRTGVIPIEAYRQWDGKSRPKEWLGDIVGRNVVVAESPRLITKETTHVRIEWPMPANSLDYFIDEIRNLMSKHGEVRIVFGFDS